jgi:hypothetical protein
LLKPIYAGNFIFNWSVLDIDWCTVNYKYPVPSDPTVFKSIVNDAGLNSPEVIPVIFTNEHLSIIFEFELLLDMISMLPCASILGGFLICENENCTILLVSAARMFVTLMENDDVAVTVQPILT